MNEMEFIDKKDLRDQAINRVEVLDKVKKLFLIPNMEVMTIGQVAEYYEVDIEVIKKCHTNNKEELDLDGVYLKTSKDFLKGNYFPLKLGQGRVGFQIDSDTTLVIPNRGIRCFSKRAVLRIGMLLRDSQIAKEVRTQLLNVFEHSSDEQKTIEIDNEQELFMRFAKAAIEGEKEDLLFAAQEVFQYKNRHIAKLQQEKQELTDNNKMLSAQILEWDDRAKLNKAIRVIAGFRQVPFGYIWKELYNELLYKHHISLSQRGGKPYIQHVRQNEWDKVQQSLCAICEDNGISISRVMWKVKHDIANKFENDTSIGGEVEYQEENKNEEVVTEFLDSKEDVNV